MARFVDRVSEMETLEQEYRRDGSSFVVVYGRRRVGKTTLINEFCRGKSALYYLATEESEAQNRMAFRDMVADYLGNPLMPQVAFGRWEPLFEMLVAEGQSGEKLVLVIDEFQYLGKANEAFPSIFQRVWDTILSRHNVMVILCGSLVTLMSSQVLDYESPLYGRRTAQIHMRALPFSYYHEFFKKKSRRELVEFYSVTGGIPKYIELFEDDADIYRAISRNILNPDSFLFDEPTFLLQKEVTEIGSYFSIIKAIAAGNQRVGAIATRLEVSQTGLSRHLKTLVSLDVIEREVPVTEKNPENSKKSLYRVKDNFLQFWFQFVQPGLSYLESGHEKVVLERLKKSFVDRHVAYVYEEICRGRLWELSAEGVVPVFLEKVGRWWDAHDCEIDVVGLSESDNAIVFGECKFKTRPIGVDVLTELEEKSRNVTWGSPNRVEFFVLFSMSGFSDALKALADERADVFLFE